MKSISNLKMHTIAGKIKIQDLVLDPELEKLLSRGFLNLDGCFFLKAFFDNQKHIKKEDFIDKTGYECFINSIHIDDYVEKYFYEQSLLLIEAISKMWIDCGEKGKLKLLLSETDYGFNLKFHKVRKNEIWLNEDEIDSFEEAIRIYEI